MFASFQSANTTPCDVDCTLVDRITCTTRQAVWTGNTGWPNKYDGLIGASTAPGLIVTLHRNLEDGENQGQPINDLVASINTSRLHHNTLQRTQCRRRKTHLQQSTGRLAHARGRQTGGRRTSEPAKASDLHKQHTDLPPLSSIPTPSYTTPYDIVPYLPDQPKSLSGISLRAFCLGASLSANILIFLATLIWTSSPLWRVPFFIACLSVFHFLEFWTTATYNTPDADVGSFLLTSNGAEYAIGHTSAVIECLITHLVWSKKRGFGPVATLIGFVLVVGGQTIRTLAMKHAGRSFSHYVQRYKKPEQTLVTTGVYSVLRHPSYFGFYWWAMGTQLVMGNWVCLVGYIVALHKFFAPRVVKEEKFLVEFFGEEYVNYRKRTRVGIPFVG